LTTLLLNTDSSLYPALKRRTAEVGEELSAACSVVLPSSWEQAAGIILDDLMDRRRIADWWDLEVHEDARAVAVSVRPPFLSRAFFARVVASVPEAFSF
jgi:hypothetical protein